MGLVLPATRPQVWSTTKKISWPSSTIQRRRALRLVALLTLSHWAMFAHDTSGPKKALASSRASWVVKRPAGSETRLSIHDRPPENDVLARQPTPTLQSLRSPWKTTGSPLKGFLISRSLS